MTFPRSRILLALLLMTLTGALVAPAASQADAGSGSSAEAAKKRKVAPRKGGKVRKAWPAKKSRGNRPNKKLAQFLAKQVGPTVVAKKRASARSARAPRPPARCSSSSPRAKPRALRLVRSFDVPAGDPAAARMANLSWTYDSAVAAVALMNAGEKTQAEQLLDQLAALQRTDGSIDYAFNVSNGSSLQLFNTGAIAWAGVAAATVPHDLRLEPLRRARRRHAPSGCSTASCPAGCWPAARPSPGPRPSTTSSPGTCSCSSTDRLPSGVSASTVTKRSRRHGDGDQA